MDAHAHCSACGASLADGAPAGLCPRCLLALALDEDGEPAEGVEAAGLPGTIGHYAILERVGAGGMGEVWLARDARLDRRVALKLLPARLQYDAEVRARFLEEARAAAALDHPYICHIHEVGSADGLDYIAMEYVEGVTLAERLRAGPPPVDEMLRHALAIGEALEAAHDKRIVHRDLKPANIMVTRQGHIKIMDFGLAKRLKPGGQTSSLSPAPPDAASLTDAGRIVGTVAYMAPEQLRAEPVSTAADLFAFGVVLYEMLGGVHPFARPSMLETAHAILADDPPPLRAAGAPPALVAIVLRLLCKPADARGSIHAARRTLASLVAGRPAETSARTPASWSRRIAAVVLPLVLLGTVLAFEHVANRPFPSPADDRREVYVTLAFDRWGSAGEDRLLLETSRKLRSQLEQVLTALPATDVVVRPEYFDSANVPSWSYDRSPGRVVESLRGLGLPVDLVLRNRLEQPEPETLLLLSSLQRLHGERLVSTGRFVRAEGAAADLVYLTLRVVYGFWGELERDAGDVFGEQDRREIGRRILVGLQESLVRQEDDDLRALVDQALAADYVSREDVASILAAHGRPVDAARLAERIAARRRANLTKLQMNE